MLKIRRPLGRLIFNMGIAIPGKTVFLIETAPGGRVAIRRSTQHGIVRWEQALKLSRVKSIKQEQGNYISSGKYAMVTGIFYDLIYPVILIFLKIHLSALLE